MLNFELFLAPTINKIVLTNEQTATHEQQNKPINYVIQYGLKIVNYNSSNAVGQSVTIM